MANIIDIGISVPQFVNVVIKGEIGATSSFLVWQYFIGDIIKVGAFVLGSIGWAFIGAALLQTCVDGLVVVSLWTRKKTGSVYQLPSSGFD